MGEAETLESMFLPEAVREDTKKPSDKTEVKQTLSVSSQSFSVASDPDSLGQAPLVLLYRLQEACADNAENEKLLRLLADAKAFIHKVVCSQSVPQKAKKKGFWSK